MPLHTLALLLAACTSGDDTAEDTSGGTPDEVPDLPTGGCGGPGWSWVPLAGMGAIVAAEEDEGLHLTAAFIQSIVDAMAGGASPLEIRYGVRTWRVRYVTQDRGVATEATLLAVLPDVTETTSFPAVMWGHGTSGFTDACAPSAAGFEGAAGPLLVASLGFAVAAPDYLGMAGFGEPSGCLHPYLVPEATAVASLDAVRALTALATQEGTPAVPDLDRLVPWGASEGGFAALWTDRYAGGYAPEMTVVATVAAVPPLGLTALAAWGLTHLGQTSRSIAAAAVTQHPWYGGPGGLADLLTDAPPRYVASTLPAEMAETCSDFPSIADAGLEEIFQPAVLAAAEAGDMDALQPWGCYQAQGDLASSAIPRGGDAPVLVILSELDTWVVSDVVRGELPLLCDEGYVIEHIECAGASHSEGAIQSLPYQADWARARLEGDPLDPGIVCTITEPQDCTELRGR
ncbi:MAG: hypothetical protein JXB39_01600 [Deltaproteobacteria bacterium]|nr:hypothetical protein [Deltaproteobacteria bacterium]